MGNLFNIENGFFSTIGKIVDIVFLSIIWLICCIPIITIGPANTALYYTVVKVIRRERGYLLKEFFKSFRLNFKRGLIIGIIIFVMLAILLVDILWARVYSNGDSKLGPVVVGIFIALSVIVVSVSVYIYPLLSRFDMTVKHLFKTSLIMSIKHLPSTFTMVVLTVGAILGVLLVQPILILILPALSILIISFPMERIFKKYMPSNEEAETDSAKDEWYLE